jgi:hypothetical protein
MNTITIAASQTNTLQPVQGTMVIGVTSGLTAVRDDVTAALLGAGITGTSFSSVTIQQQSSGLSLTFYVFGVSSSQAQLPPTCPAASLVANAQTQAQQVGGPIAGANTGYVRQPVFERQFEWTELY